MSQILDRLGTDRRSIHFDMLAAHAGPALATADTVRYRRRGFWDMGTPIRGWRGLSLGRIRGPLGTPHTAWVIFVFLGMSVWVGMMALPFIYEGIRICRLL